MTKEQKDRILKALEADKNYFVKECERRMAEEQGKIIGADYMLQRFKFFDVLDIESQENEENEEEE